MIIDVTTAHSFRSQLQPTLGCDDARARIAQTNHPPASAHRLPRLLPFCLSLFSSPHPPRPSCVPAPYTPFPLATKSHSSSHLSPNISTARFLVQYSPQRMRPQGASSDSKSDPDPLNKEEDDMIYIAKHLGNGIA
ncbi:hypothetical protein EDB84DRAFT_1564451 [Lactarius hengduanensis]|nr:hypothetical protein EDB84DRAFT_1564451 [Lactarius hengduanensis]